MSRNGRVTREREICGWVGRMGAVEVGHIQRRWGVGRSVAYGLVQRLEEAELLERVPTLAGDPTLIKATTSGIEYARLALPVAKIGPGQVDHWLSCADVVLWAEESWGRCAVTTERELRWIEQAEDKPIGSCVVGELPNGRPMLHRPDLLISTDDQRFSIEVELTTKAPRRLEHLVRSWRRARHVDRVIYLVATGPPYRAVERAVRNVHAEERVEVLDLESVCQRAGNGS
jgi:DNA-binding MarR family transcriptional regulator